jgi:hypothetical protein|tara:strand:+ start:1058 stop:1327 length:270 start_codon:yes stop_codon:yes gene_type:complete
MDRLAMIKAAAEKARDEQIFKKTVKAVYSKPKYKAPRLTQSMKKAAHLSPGNLDCFKEENMYYSDKDTQAFIAGSSIMDAYNEGKNDWD